MLDSILNRLLERRARKFGKGCARVMLISFQAAKEHYKGEASTYAWLARKALNTRPHWKQVNETAFAYDLGPGGTQSAEADESNNENWLKGVVDIDDAMSLLDVIQEVIRVELYWHVLTDLDAWQRLELIDVAVGEASNYMHK